MGLCQCKWFGIWKHENKAQGTRRDSTKARTCVLASGARGIAPMRRAVGGRAGPEPALVARDVDGAVDPQVGEGLQRSATPAAGALGDVDVRQDRRNAAAAAGLAEAAVSDLLRLRLGAGLRQLDHRVEGLQQARLLLCPLGGGNALCRGLWWRQRRR